MIAQIQDAAMNRIQDAMLDGYLWMSLLCMKYPFTYDFEWFRKAVRMVEEEYCIKVPILPQNQNFVYSILVDTWLAVMIMNNRFKRVIFQQVGKIWYDKKFKTKTIFGENAVLWWEKKSVCVERHIFRGYLVSTENGLSDSKTDDAICNIQDKSNS